MVSSKKFDNTSLKFGVFDKMIDLMQNKSEARERPSKRA